MGELRVRHYIDMLTRKVITIEEYNRLTDTGKLYYIPNFMKGTHTLDGDKEYIRIVENLYSLLSKEDFKNIVDYIESNTTEIGMVHNLRKCSFIFIKTASWTKSDYIYITLDNDDVDKKYQDSDINVRVVEDFKISKRPPNSGFVYYSYTVSENTFLLYVPDIWERLYKFTLKSKRNKQAILLWYVYLIYGFTF